MRVAKLRKTDFLNHFRLVLCIGILFSLLAHPSSAKACSCVADVTIPDNFAMHDAVFTGKVVRIVDNYAPIFSTLDYLIYKLGYPSYFFRHFIENDERRLGFSIFFKVINSWKGLDASFIEVSTGRGTGDCGYSFLTHEEYLIYLSHAYGIPGNDWVTSICSGNSILSATSTEELNYLNTFPILPLKTTIPTLWTEKDTIISALLLIPIASIIFIKRRRQLQKRHQLLK